MDGANIISFHQTGEQIVINMPLIENLLYFQIELEVYPVKS